MRERVAAIVGVAESDLGRVAPKTALQLQAQAAKSALEDAGLTLRDVDGLLTATNDWSTSPSMLVGEYLGVSPSYTDTTNIGGASFEAHVGHAVAAIRAGLCQVALITYGSTQRSDGGRQLGRTGRVRYPDQFERIWGLPMPVGAYALAARRHMYLYGTTSEQLAEVAVATRKWASLNPKAHRREPITVDDVLSSPLIADPLHALDCCLVSDGGGAVVVAAEAVARNCRKLPVWILGQGESHSAMTVSNLRDITVTPAVQSGKRAFGMAGIGPHEVDVVELYDSFTITVLLSLEDLGFCPKGEAGPFVAGQRTAPGGDFPLNTNGGGLSYCHPGMYGIFLLIEAVRQLRGECGERQVPSPRLALANGIGGFLTSAATVILGND